MDTLAPPPQTPAPARRGAGPVLIRAGLAALALFGLSRLVHARDLARALSIVERVGWPLGLVLLPTMAAMMLDAYGWRAILATLGHKVRWRRMVELRLSVEAIVLALPGGSLAGEAAKVALLDRRAGVPLTVGAASLALTKLLLFASDSAYLAVAALALACHGWPSGAAPLQLALAGAAFTGVAALALGSLLRRSRLATRLSSLIGRAPSARLRRWIKKQQPRFVELDRAARLHFEAPLRTRLGCFLVFLLEWLTEGLETFVILRCVGLSLGLGETLALDGIGSLLRALAIFVPAGVGVQDAAQIILLRQLGVPDAIATGAAFIFIKRTKEVFWTVMGLLFLAARRDLWRRAGDSRGPGAA